MKSLAIGFHLQVRSLRTDNKWFDFGPSVKTLKGIERLKKKYEKMYDPPKVKYKILQVIEVKENKLK